LESKDFFDYCRNALHKDFFIVPKHNNVKIKEFKETKLKEVRVYFEVDNYNVLQITFDINNLEKIEDKVNIFPYFNGEICKSVDSIILVQEKNTENYYLFHIELKSQKPDNTEIFKKYISSIKMLNFIFDVLYLKYREESRNFKFPEKIVNMPILFFSEHNKRLKSRKKKETKLLKNKFSSNKYVNFKEEYHYYFYNFMGNHKGIIRLKEMCSKAKNIGAMLSKIKFFES
jgi:hypothetical protein fuD12_00370